MQRRCHVSQGHEIQVFFLKNQGKYPVFVNFALQNEKRGIAKCNKSEAAGGWIARPTSCVNIVNPVDMSAKGYAARPLGLHVAIGMIHECGWNISTIMRFTDENRFDQYVFHPQSG